MIAFANPKPRKPRVVTETWQERFLKMLPLISIKARYATRWMRGEFQDEARQEIIANAFSAYARLVERDKEHVALPGVLAKYAIRHFFAGRRVGTRFNIRDVMSNDCHRFKGVRVERLDRPSDNEANWREAVIEDPKANVFQLAAFRIDFSEWLSLLPKRTRRIALAMARSETTADLAKRFKVSAGRISQIRRELFNSWRAFHDVDRLLKGNPCLERA